jgi:hypothetical protein
MLPKKFDLFLLGAGASVDAGIPASRSLAETLIRNLAAARWSNDRAQDAAEYIWAALEANHRRRTIEARTDSSSEYTEHQIAQPDVETLIQAIDRLADRRDDVLRPFVGSWDETLTLLERAPLDHNRAAREVAEAIGRRFAEASEKTATKVKNDVRQQFRSLPTVSRTSNEVSKSVVADAAGDAVAGSISALGTSVERAFESWSGRLVESLGRLTGFSASRSTSSPPRSPHAPSVYKFALPPAAVMFTVSVRSVAKRAR